MNKRDRLSARKHERVRVLIKLLSIICNLIRNKSILDAHIYESFGG